MTDQGGHSSTSLAQDGDSHDHTEKQGGMEEVLERNSLRVPLPALDAAIPITQRRLSRTGRLSFHEQEVHIPPSKILEGQQADDADTSDSSHNSSNAHEVVVTHIGAEIDASTTSIKENRKSLLKSLQSIIGGGSFRAEFALGQRSLSNTINISAESKLDMSLFQTKKMNSWSKHGVTLATDNLSYFVEKKESTWNLFTRHRRPRLRKTNGSTTPTHTRKALLKHVTITVLPGEVAFVMGPSGAGKSTLLDALAGRIKTGIMSGHVYFNGKPRGHDFYENSAYVRQDDVHIPNLTVEETLYFAAKLRLGENEYTEEERRLRINAVADLLGLNTCLISMVGDSGMRGISGGQLKRLSIAVEIMNMPSLIFLDEPTSGLDSVMAHDVMTFTHRLADQNRTILATIHQPSSETFELASKVILVTAGRVAYCGPANEAQEYFTSSKLGYSAHEYTNPADFIIAVVSGAEPSSSLDIKLNADPKKLSEIYEASSYFQEPLIKPESSSSHTAFLIQSPVHFPTSITNQTMTLLTRFWIAHSRQWEFVVAQLGKNIIVATVCGIIFFNQGHKKSTTTFSNSSFNISSLWYFAMLYTVLSCLQIIPQLFFFKVLYTRERSANVYSTFAYWASNAVVSIPLLLFSHIVFVELAYWLVGLYANPSCHFYAMVVTFMNNLISFYCAQFMAAISPSAEVALTLFPLIFLFLGSFAGFTIPLSELPPGWKWASYISYPRWTYEALIINEFEHRLDNVAVLNFYSFNNFNKFYVFPLLALFMVFVNVLVYMGLLPARSRLRFEGSTSPGDSPKKEVLLVEDPIIIPSPCTLTLDDFRVRSSHRIPSTAGRSLVFRDLEYSIGQSPDRAAKILKGVSGYIYPGQMCALMGGSGAGKSTLLDLLAYRKTGGFITGEYYIDGQPEKPNSKWCSYVTQDNVHISLFTVRETLEYAALLRLDEKTTIEKRKERADDVMQMLGLEEVADVLVGNHMIKGISGGQARRLTIGVEIVQLPDVIFLDEPTTGLDSQISHEVMSSVRNIANHNRTVVCTIHSPSESVYRLFDSLILLALGRQTYFGPVNKATDYFSQSMFGWTMPLGKNPADFIMEANQGLLSATDGSRRTIRELNQVFLSSSYYTDIDSAVEKVVTANGGKSSDEEQGGRSKAVRRIRSDSVVAKLIKPEKYPRSTFSQIYILGGRQFKKMLKMRTDIMYTLLRNVLVACFHGSLYTNLSPGAIQSRLSLLFFAIMFVMMANQSFIPNVFDDRLLFYRERGAGVYGSVPYWISSSLAYVPQCAAATVTYSTIVYFMSGLNTENGAFGYFCTVVLLSSLCGLYFCQLVSLMAPNPQIAVSIFPAALFLMVVFAGFVVRLPTLPNWLGSWAPLVSFARWGFQGLVINEFQNNVKIDYYEIIPIKVTDPYSLFIENFGFEGYSKWDTLPIMGICLAILFIICYIPIRFISFEKR